MPGDPVPPSIDTGFEVVRRGYDQGQVDTHLRTLDAQISILVADRNAALEQANQLARELDESRVRAEKLRAQVRTLVSPGQNVQGMSERMRAMLRLAQDEVTDMLSGAATEVTRRLTESETQAKQIVADAKAEAESTLNAARSEAEFTLTSARAEAESTLTSARAEAESTLTSARSEAAATLESARTEAESTRLNARAEADATVKRATAEAEAMVSAARSESERQAQERDRARVELDAERSAWQELLAAQRREAEQTLAAEMERAEQERARAWAESEERRITAEEDFTLALDQRRAEALGAIAAERREAHRQAEELRELAVQRFQEEEAKAKEMGRAIVGDAELHLAELIEMRKRIGDQLGEARVQLDRTLERITATPERTSTSAVRTDGGGAVPTQRDLAAGGAGSGGEAGSGDTGSPPNGRPRPRPQAAAGRR